MSVALGQILFVTMVLVIQRRPRGEDNQIIRGDKFEMLVPQLLVLLGIKWRVEKNVPVFVSQLCQGSRKLGESRSVADFRWLGHFTRPNRHRISKAMIQVVRFHFCYEQVTANPRKLKSKQINFGI